MLLLTACATTSADPDALGDRPPLSRFQASPKPAVPAATVPCAHNPLVLCVSDADTADFIRQQNAAIDERDRKLCWLQVYDGYPPCQAPSD